MDIIRIFVGDRLAFEGHQVRDIGYPTAEDPYWTIHLVDGRTVDTTERITIVRGAQTNTDGNRLVRWVVGGIVRSNGDRCFSCSATGHRQFTAWFRVFDGWRDGWPDVVQTIGVGLDKAVNP